MHQHHYDIIILGDSLASRLAAVLLAKAGKKVLSFRPQQPPFTPWLFNSIHLGHVLEQLGGRNCLTTPRKLQVITSQSRLELHGKQPLSDELRREFPSSHDQIADLLQALDTLGKRLESQLLLSGGPLFDLAGSLRFRRKLLFNRPGLRTLRKPLTCLLDEITDPKPRACLEALFSGLSMAPADRLTIAEGALLWSSTSQNQGISRSALDDLLQRRYEQFHGCCEPLEAVEKIGIDNRIYLRNAGVCSADTFIIGNSEAINSLPGNEQKLVRVQPTPCRWKTSPILIGASPVLASRVILADPRTLRVTLNSTPTGTVCTAEYQWAANPSLPSENELHAQLAGILPFASFGISPQTAPQTADSHYLWPTGSAFPGASLRLTLKKNLLIGSGADALPHLGSTGEIMTGVALTRYLLRAEKQRA